MAYDASKASVYNKLVQSGLSPEAAATQAGISAAERGNYAVTGRFNNDGTQNPNPGTLGPKIATKQNDLTEEDGALFAQSGFNTQAEARENAAFFKGAGGSDDFDDKPSGVARVRYQQKLDATNTAPGKVVESDYTTTSTENVSGGGVTTVVSTPSTPTAASRAAQTQADATLREIESLQLENSGFGSGPALTEAQMAANDARILQLTEKYDRERAAATSSQVPGVPSVTTVPNTTTTERTVLYQTSSENSPVASTAAQPVVSTPSISDGETQRSPLGIGGNYSSVFNPETGTYDIINLDNGQIVESGLSELNAEVTASQFSQGDPQFETPEMPPDLPDLTEPEVPGGNFGSVFDPETQSWSVIDNDTGVIVQTGFTDSASAELQAQLDSQPDPYTNQLDDDEINAGFTESDLVREPTDQDADEYLTEGFVQTEGGLYVLPEEVDGANDPYAQLVEETEDEGGLVEFTQDGPVGVNSNELATRQANMQATLANARAQAALKAQRKQADDGDWRVKLRLAPGSNYLYRATDGSGQQAGILQPLVDTDGVVFPYTPQINTNYKANYNAYDLTHSNYRGYFYQGSTVEEIGITATFTAQDTYEAQYLLAVIHFFRSITKMFYGKDANAGTPPPLVFLQGLGEYQFNLHPCVVSQFTYNLPNDVDYIRARSPNQANMPPGMLQNRRASRQTVATNPFEAAWNRLRAAGGAKGGLNPTPAPAALGTKSPTYVPTKVDLQITLLPVQSRSQVSNNFSLQKYANGDLLKGGFW